MSNPFDSKAYLIDKLGQDAEKFTASNLILPNKKGIGAVYQLYGLQSDLLKFATDPSMTPAIPKMPQEPDTEGMTPEQKAASLQDYAELKDYWNMLRQAHMLKVSESDFMHIKDYLSKYFMAMHTTPAIKGARFHAFTKAAGEPKKQGGFMGLLKGGNRDE
jgi:hypothetical protein